MSVVRPLSTAAARSARTSVSGFNSLVPGSRSAGKLVVRYLGKAVTYQGVTVKYGVA